MKKLSELRKSKKGFTLVEIIVVLVILAILAAIAIPNMIGFINNAHSQQTLAEAGSVKLASEAIAIQKYDSDATTGPTITYTEINEKIGQNLCTDTTDSSEDGYVSVTANTSSQITAITYTNHGYTATYDGKSWTTAKAA